MSHMERNMTPPAIQKQENPHYLRLVPITRTPEELLDLEFREAIVGLETDTPRPKRFYKIAAGELYPMRVLARVIRDALAADVDPVDVLRALWRPLQRFVTRLATPKRPQFPSAPDRKRLKAA